MRAARCPGASRRPATRTKRPHTVTASRGFLRLRLCTRRLRLLRGRPAGGNAAAAVAARGCAARGKGRGFRRRLLLPRLSLWRSPYALPARLQQLVFLAPITRPARALVGLGTGAGFGDSSGQAWQRLLLLPLLQPR